MARRESVAVAGYYPTPQELIPRIGRIVAPPSDGGVYSFLDPCAGEGAALFGLADSICKGDKSGPLYSVEMEKSRYEGLLKRYREAYRTEAMCLHGDAFLADWQKESYYGSPSEGVSVLYLNPPYDSEPRYKRLEHRFLVRFTEALAEGGVLLFVVPGYALEASAEFLGLWYESLHCFKFPDPHYDVYKQVVLCGTKTSARLYSDPNTVNQVMGWSKNPSQCPELPNMMEDRVLSAPESQRYGSLLPRWEMKKLDFRQISQEVVPWVYNGKRGTQYTLSTVLPSQPVQELLLRNYPVATPPRPSHIASGIAAGVFNGHKISPDPEFAGRLPSILLKGVFVKEYRTIEEKETKEGTSLIQVQQPSLVVSALNLETGIYRTIPSEGSNTAETFDELTIPSLLAQYSGGLMQAMEAQCPIMYDPRIHRGDIALADTTRKPYVAQADAAKALTMLLRQNGKAILLGEIGCGKSQVSLTVAKTYGAKKLLVICPPHLLTGWGNEVKSVWPSAKVVVLETIEDVERVAVDPSSELVMLMTREAAKLSHGWESVGHYCPKCGGETPKEDHAKKHSRCKLTRVTGDTFGVRVGSRIASQLVKHDPSNPTYKALVSGAVLKGLRGKKPLNPDTFEGVPESVVRELFEELKHKTHNHKVWELLTTAFLATKGNSVLLEAIEFFRNSGQSDKVDALEYFLPLDHPVEVRYGYRYQDLLRYREGHDTAVPSILIEAAHRLGVQYFAGSPRGSFEHAKNLFDLTLKTWKPKVSGPCGEFLYQASPDPRRYGLSQYIHRRHKNLFDFMILDEAHEYGNDNSAQSRANLRLAGSDKPTIAMSGSIMNGYAESLFPLMWVFSKGFREEFSREDKQRFIDRYGYRKRLVREDDVVLSVTGHGSNSERREVSEKAVGNAPGILPLFILKHLLPVSVTLHKTDLQLELPPCTQERVMIQPSKEMTRNYDRMLRELLAQIQKDRKDPELAGKLFGQLAEFPGYMDRCTEDTGNVGTSSYEVRYPESVGGDAVTSCPLFESSYITPKEQWMLEELERRIQDGENVMVLGWHTNTLPRLQRLIQNRLGIKVAVLYADKVPTRKRQDWISQNVVNPGIKVMVSNPVCIQTGLNNLVHFSCQIWMQNPAANPIVYRQAIGRVDRIGKKRPSTILVPVYQGTMQETMFDLLLQKVAVSTSTDGLDPESALLAAGIGAETFLTGLSLGKQLWAMLQAA